LDLSAPMLAIARERNRFTNVRFERGDLCDLPFPDGSADVVTGSYALRNAPDLRKAVAEVRRVLSPDGVAAFLDFSNPERSLPRHLQYLLLRSWCGFWGRLLHGSPEIHGYIAESLRLFPDRNRLREIFREQRLGMVTYRRFFLGITGLIVLRPIRTDTPSFPAPP